MATKKDKENLLYKFNNEINEKMHIFFIDLEEGCKSYAHMNDDMNNLYNIFIKSKEIISMLEVDDEPIEEDKSIEGNTIGISKITMPFSLNELELTGRSENALKAYNINTIGKLLDKTEYDLRKLNNIGKETVREIKEALSNHGLKLKEDTCQ